MSYTLGDLRRILHIPYRLLAFSPSSLPRYGALPKSEADCERFHSLEKHDVLVGEMEHSTRDRSSHPFRRTIWSIVVLVGFIVTLTMHRQYANDHRQLASIQNSTLGFQQIFAIGMPDRKHKHDAQLLAAQQTGLKLTFARGVPWKEVPENEWIDDTKIQETKNHGAGLIGAWRAHMDVLERIVEEDIQTALIIEDDADWDVFVKEQMPAFAEAVLALQGTRPGSSKTSPYGDDWELLWPGACQLAKALDDQYYVVDNDTTAAPPWHRWLWYGGPEELSRKNTRITFRPSYAVCTTAYAVTNAAARKLLARVGLHAFKDAHDTQFGRMCGGVDNEPPLKCYTTWPPLFAMHRFEGLNAKDSDIWGQGAGSHPEYSFSLVYSAIRNIPRIQWGNDTVVSQYEDVDEVTVAIDKKHQFYGTIQTVRKVEQKEG